MNFQKVVLSLDTSGSNCSVCLTCEESGQAYKAEHNAKRGHDQWLFGLIQKVLDEAQCEVADIVKIIVVVGPGSFTGLRIAGSAAKSLSIALQVPVFGVQTFDAIFYQLQPEARQAPVSIVVPTQTGLFNVKHFRESQAQYEQLSIEQMLALLESGQKCIFAFEDHGLSARKVEVASSSAWGAFQAFLGHAYEPFTSPIYFH
ncbi:MAG: tRNA (adenosine(37)-N6)-threonylcarbamoyltransferase complex dimerization subunit type 1 TsaB, partial [Alphaproteobacteria bacterium]|nr:tRNA (adenosine(37)-N6)-threonylcarbamoyltransferase complex dimerization subunit type 1 TsaB [Alphaproteobacteria bacterium]